MKKVVVKVAVHGSKEKQKAMQAVSGLSGIESFELDLNDQKLTITGDIDPVDVVALLRKHWYTEIVSFGPLETKEEPSKKDDDEPKKETVEKDDDDEEDDEKEITEAEHIADLIMASNNYYPYHPCIQPHYYYYVPQRQNPNACVIS